MSWNNIEMYQRPNLFFVKQPLLEFVVDLTENLLYMRKLLKPKTCSKRNIKGGS